MSFPSNIFGGGPANVSPSGPPFPGDSADNGLSVDPAGIIVLGQDDGDATNPAILLNDREIPMDEFVIRFTDMKRNGSKLIFQEDNTFILPSPFIEFSDISDNEIGRINFLSDIGSGGDGGSVYIGRNAGSNDTLPNGNNVGIGWRTLELMDVGFANTGAGYENMSLLTGGTNNTSMGASVFNNLVNGGFNAGFGDSLGFNLVDGIGNSFFGSNSAQGFYGSSSNNVVFGSSAVMQGAPSPVVNDNSILGAFSFVDGGAQFGDRNILIGAHNNQHAGIITDDNIIIGNNNQVDTIFNTMIFGSGKTVSGLPNIVILGDDSQNTLIGAPVTGMVDNGNRLQVFGTPGENGIIGVYDSTNPLNIILIGTTSVQIAGDVGSSDFPVLQLQDAGGSGEFDIFRLADRATLGNNTSTNRSLNQFNTGGNWRIGDIASIDAGHTLQVDGDLQTAAPNTGTADGWKLGRFEAGAVVATGGVRININGTDYKIPAVAA